MQKLKSAMVLGLMGLLVVAAVATAQEERRRQRGGERGGQRQRGGRTGRGGFGGRGFTASIEMTKMQLLRDEAVQKELDLLDEQKAEIRKLTASLRQQGRGRGGRPGGGRPGGERRPARPGGDQGASLRPDGTILTQQEEPRRRQPGGRPGGGRGGFDFAAMQKRIAEIIKKIETDILLPPQVDRLNELSIQRLGTQALNIASIQTKLGITGDQKKKFESVREAQGKKRQELFSSLFRRGGGERPSREEMMKKFRELQEGSQKELLAVLTADQKKKFDEMKGEPFKFTARRGFGGFGGGRRPGGRPGGGRRPGRPGGEGDRPRRPNN